MWVEVYKYVNELYLKNNYDIKVIENSWLAMMKVEKYNAG